MAARDVYDGIIMICYYNISIISLLFLYYIIIFVFYLSVSHFTLDNRNSVLCLRKRAHELLLLSAAPSRATRGNRCLFWLSEVCRRLWLVLRLRRVTAVTDLIFLYIMLSRVPPLHLTTAITVREICRCGCKTLVLNFRSLSGKILRKIVRAVPQNLVYLKKIVFLSAIIDLSIHCYYYGDIFYFTLNFLK